MRSIYLDNHATTPTDPRVLEAMLPYFTEHFGNAASHTHSYGWEASEAVERGREQVAALIGARAKDIIFTSGATESNNLAIKGIAAANAQMGRHLITCATEHKAVLDTMHWLEDRGFEVTSLRVQRTGSLDLDELKAAIRPDTILISLMAANNEIGTLHPISEIGGIAREHKVLFHCDAAQAVGKVPIDVRESGIDLLSISGHKMYGPKGIGALYVRRQPSLRLEPILHGGGHERGYRSGTLNVPGCVGLGAAAEIAAADLQEEVARVAVQRDKLHQKLESMLAGVILNGHPSARLPGNLNLSFEGVEAEAVMMHVREIAVSSGSACTSATPEPSHVLQAIGLPDELAYGSIRFGLGRFTTDEELDYTATRVVEAVTTVRKMMSGEPAGVSEGA